MNNQDSDRNIDEGDDSNESHQLALLHTKEDDDDDDYRSVVQLSSSNTADFHSLARRLRNLESDRIDLLNLYHLCLDYNEAHEVIGQLYRFREVRLDDCFGDSEYLMLEQVFQHPSIQRFEYVCSQEDGPPDIIASSFSRGLQGAAHGLKELCLRVCMTPAFTQALLFDGINQSLSTQDWTSISFLNILDLSQCEFTNPDSITTLCSGLQENVGLTDLILENCHLNDDELKEIVNSIVQHPTLKKLSLALNYAGSNTIEAVATLLYSQTQNTITPSRTGSLEHLNLGQQSPGHLRNVHLIYRALEHNNTLKSMCLCENYLYRSQLPQLVQALEMNETLEELNLEDCDFRKEGIETLLASLSRYPFLRKLWLRKNMTPQSEESLDLSDTLLDQMKDNDVIQLLDVDEEWILDTQKKIQIDDFLHLNRCGRRFLKTPVENDRFPLGMWPVLIERAQKLSLKRNEDSAVESQEWKQKNARISLLHTTMFLLLRGPALCQR
ncbi:hypothetical protein IV203_026568 [Nitzschia inconspicua]|uniref:Uncharacterized protein n=1 Tax=Nitzschia inconspicua TaxID=303405 RepID=A0A9K3PXC9_9STRA|nr:hypothetical protein IV203_026568 [Nitzschia inconspicua]